MKVTFYGATREVTGSCYLVETSASRILVDCGMFQGSAFTDAKNFRDFGFNPSSIDSVIVTHAHLDHVGRLPKLVRNGFKGKIYATPPTVKLAKVVLDDAVAIMDDEFRREYRPKLYDQNDVNTVIKRFVPIEYSRRVRLGGLTFRFRDAGHIIGSAFVEIEEAGGPCIAFSGDLGNVPNPILRPTAQLVERDVLVMESTYGNRLHERVNTREQRLKDSIVSTLTQKGVLIIPAFAIERAQELLYELNHLVENHLVPSANVYLDSPMAIEALGVVESFPQYYNDHTREMVERGEDPFSFPGLRLTRTREQSKTINESPNPKVIIAGSGMMNGGRILHHLLRYLGNKKNTILIIGYQAHGTLGRHLYLGDRRVDVLHKHITVKARIESIDAYSAHADQQQLINWVGAAKRLPGHIYCTHGEEESSIALVSRLTKELGVTADVPHFEQTVEL